MMADRISIFVKGWKGLDVLNENRGNIPITTAIKILIDHVSYDPNYVRSVLKVNPIETQTQAQ